MDAEWFVGILFFFYLWFYCRDGAEIRDCSNQRPQ